MTPNQAQKDFWSEQAGTNWVRMQDSMDATLGPVLDLVLEFANLQSDDRVLDIGCGAGTSTLRAGQAVGDRGHVLGVDISKPLLARAQERANDVSNVEFTLADAQLHAFEPQGFDHLISRFGVMFFEDSVAAFSNISKALRPDAKVTLGCWGPAPENPWFMLPAKVAKMRFGSPPKTDRSLPGPFAWENPDRILPMLERAGLRNVTAQSHHIDLTPAGSLSDLADACLHIGPATGIMSHFNASEADRTAIRANLMDIFAPFQTAQGLRIPASILLYKALGSGIPD